MGRERYFSRGSAPPSRAQSTVIGVILLTGVVIISITLLGGFWLGTITDQADASGPLLEVDVTATDKEVEVHHVTGESVAISDLTILLRNDSVSERYVFDRAKVSGNGDDQFDPTDTFVRNHSIGNGTFEVLVIHEASNSVLHRERVEADSREDDEDSERDPTGGALQISSFSAPGTVDAGYTYTISATVENTGSSTGTRTVRYRFDGSVENQTNVTLAPGSTTTVELKHTIPGDHAGGNVSHGVHADGDEATGMISVEVSPTINEFNVNDESYRFWLFVWISSAEYDVSWDVSDMNSNLDTVTVQMIGPDGQTDQDVTEIGGNNASGNSTVSIDGYGDEFTIRIIATDQAGNTVSKEEIDVADGDGP